MKVAIGTALFVLLAGSTMYGQEQEKEKPGQQEEKKQEPGKKQEPATKEHPAAHEQQKAQPQEQQKAREQQQKEQQHQAQEEQKDQASGAAKHQQQAVKQQQHQQEAKQQQVAKQQQQVARQEHPNGQQAQRDGGNRNARHINEQEFHQHFGREHEFRVARSENRRFNYGGYYWVYNDPWPSDWAYTDDVYVDEADGEYYLIDPVHPGVRLLVVIAD